MTKNDNDTSETSRTRKSDDSDEGQQRIQAAFDETHAKGYFGETPDPHPNSAYSLQTGPESPGGAADVHTRVEQHVIRPEEKK